MPFGVSPTLFLGEDPLISETPRAAAVPVHASVIMPGIVFHICFPYQTVSSLRAGVT